MSAIRLNNLRSPAGLSDLDALNAAAVRPDLVMLSKVESAAEVQLAARKLPESVRLVCLIETVQGVRRCASIAEARRGWPRWHLAAWIFSAETGGEPNLGRIALAAHDRRPRLQRRGPARARPALHRFRECRRARRGMCPDARTGVLFGKLAIHPAQVGVIQRAYRPTAEQIARAQKIIAAYDAAGGNVANVDGQMIDVPIYRSAQRVLARAGQ